MKKLNKKGFTLIELMIVLAIIAILAVVLVPKAGQMKDSARNAGVTTNVNAVRGTLEAKVVDTNYLGNSSKTQTLLQSTFNGSLANPFYATATTVDPSTNYNYFATNNNNPTGTTGTDSVVVCYPGGVTPTLATLTNSLTNTVSYSANKGIVYVYVYTDGYAVFGIDSTLTAANIAIIK
jgi:type IV pilus assembly protein PilA